MESEIKKRCTTQYIKNCYFRLNLKVVACFVTSDFPSENPRTQTRNFPYTKPLANILRVPTISRILRNSVLTCFRKIRWNLKLNVKKYYTGISYSCGNLRTNFDLPNFGSLIQNYSNPQLLDDKRNDKTYG